MSIAKVCKFQLEKKEISYDCGETWNPTSTKRKIEGREPVERNSRDCGFQESRETVVSGYTCNGYDKYTQLVDIVSYDGGETWDVISGSSRLGTFVERFSSDCCQLRTVSATVCTELFRKANVDIQEASLDGETWIPTGRYTVLEYLDDYNTDCMNEYCIKYLGIPIEGASGTSYFDYNMYKNDICNTVTYYDPTCNSATANTLVGINDAYTIVGCSGIGGSASQYTKYYYVNDCKNDPYFSISIPCTDYLEKIFISSGVTGTLTSGGGPALTDIVGLGDSQITYITERAFENCTSLTSVHIPKAMYCIDLGAFRGCTAMTSVTIDSRALRNLEESYQDLYYQQFANCTSLQTVTFPNDYYGVIYKQMFFGCTSLTAVTLGNPSEIRYGAFDGCTSLSSITLGDDVTSIGSYAFAGCTSLADVYIGQTENILSNVASNAFPSGCTIHVPCDAYQYWYQAYAGSNVYITTDCATDTRTVSGTPYCDGLDKYVDVEYQISLDSGETWNTVSTAKTLVEADSPDCRSCTKLIANYSNGTSYTAVSYGSDTILTTGDTQPANYTFEYMTDAVIGDCVTEIGTMAFYNGIYPSLSSVTIGSGVTVIGDQAFRVCNKLSSVTIPDSVTTIGNGAFSTCSGLTSVSIGSGVTTIGNGAFGYCTSLTSVTIPDSVTSIGYAAFNVCSGLTSVSIGSGVTSIGNQVFWMCKGLSSITIPDSVTTIGDYGIGFCTSLTSIEIGSGITSIGSSAFYYDNALSSFTIHATTPPTLGSEAFSGTSCTIYVPASSLLAYKTATGWSDYSSQIQAIPNS